MNDPPRRRSPDGFDDDAIFADIVAHMNDDVTETEPAARPAVDHAATDTETTDTNATTEDPAPETTDTKTDTDVTTEGPTLETADEDATGGSTAESTSRAKEPAQDDTSDDDADKDTVNLPPGLATAHGDPQSVPPPQVWRAHEVDDRDEEHFDPPPVSPLPVGDLQFWAIIAGMGGGPLLLLYLVFFNRDASGYWILAAIAMSIAGFALLVSRMPRHHDDDDDGARL